MPKLIQTRVDQAPAWSTPAGPMLMCEDFPAEEKMQAAPHTIAIEQDGVSMAQLMAAMKEDAEMQKRLVKCCEELVEETVKYNDSNNKKCEFAAFEGEEAPIDAASFVRRILKYGNCSPCCIVVGILYLERMKRIFPSVCLTSRNFQRLLLTACMTAAKFLDDSYYSNKRWADVGGLDTKELNRLELEFLFRIGFSLSVTREEYDWYVRTVIDPPAEESSDEEESDVESELHAKAAAKGMPRSVSFTDVAFAAQQFWAH